MYFFDMKKTFLFPLFFFGISFLFPFFGMAQATSPSTQNIPPVLNGNVLPGPTLKEINDAGGRGGVNYVRDRFFPGIINSFIVLLLALSVGMFVLAGYFFFFSGASSQLRDKAKNILIWTIIGVVLAILSLAIVRVVLGFDLFLSA